MRNIIAFPLLALAVVLQSSLVSQIKLLSGHADLLLIILAAWALQDRVASAWHWALLACALLGFVSKMPWPVLTVGYLGVVFTAQVLQRRVWQAPLLAMFSVTLIGTIFMQILSFTVLSLLGTPLPLPIVTGSITLPSLLLNILFSIPIYTLMRDLARWVYPSEVYE
jgi:cell shape-determining protein MreD